MATQPILETLPKDFHKMPPNYNFSHRGILLWYFVRNKLERL